MKKNLIFSLALATTSVLFSGFALAQNSNYQTISTTRDTYVISAKAGGVNYVEGNVAISSKNKKSGYLLKGDTVDVGDKVSTGGDGKAEILLNPGSYVRLAENSNFEFLTTSLDNLQLKLNSGSALLEVIADDEFTVSIKTPKANFSIVESGVYRVSVLGDGSGKLAVWKGKAQAGNFQEIKSGREAVVEGNRVAITKFDRDNKDELDIWSKTRAKDLAKVNSRLQRPDLRNSLMYGFASSRWNMYNSFGLWIFDSSFGGYCFLPFGYGWSSPYGYNYGRDLWYFRLPTVIYRQPPPTTTTGGGTTATAGKVRTRIGPDTNRTMPYERVQTKIERADRTRINDNSTFPGAASQPANMPLPPASVSPSGGKRGGRVNDN